MKYKLIALILLSLSQPVQANLFLQKPHILSIEQITQIKDSGIYFNWRLKILTIRRPYSLIKKQIS